MLHGHYLLHAKMSLEIHVKRQLMDAMLLDLVDNEVFGYLEIQMHNLEC